MAMWWSEEQAAAANQLVERATFDDRLSSRDIRVLVAVIGYCEHAGPSIGLIADVARELHFKYSKVLTSLYGLQLWGYLPYWLFFDTEA